jgi:hypothetical protein
VYRFDQTEPRPPLSHSLDFILLLALATEITIAIVSPFRSLWPALASPWCSIDSPLSALQVYPKIPSIASSTTRFDPGLDLGFRCSWSFSTLATSLMLLGLLLVLGARLRRLLHLVAGAGWVSPHGVLHVPPPLCLRRWWVLLPRPKGRYSPLSLPLLLLLSLQFLLLAHYLGFASIQSPFLGFQYSWARLGSNLVFDIFPLAITMLSISNVCCLITSEALVNL